MDMKCLLKCWLPMTYERGSWALDWHYDTLAAAMVMDASIRAVKVPYSR